MSFADWKKRSKRYAEMMKRQAYYRRDVDECCQAAYKAGERRGRQAAETLLELANKAFEQERQTDAAIYQCPACGREYSGLLKCPRCGKARV